MEEYKATSFIYNPYAFRRLTQNLAVRISELQMLLIHSVSSNYDPALSLQNLKLLLGKIKTWERSLFYLDTSMLKVMLEV